MQWKHVPLSIGTNALPFAWTKLGRTLRDTFASVPILGSALPQALGTAASGTSADAAREDHVHAHGSLLGGTLHAAATQLAAGFMSAVDKLKLDGIAAGATATPLSSANPSNLGVTNAGTGTSASKDDHVHAHGTQAGGDLHAVATAEAAGFLSASDKSKLDTLSPGGGGGALAPTDTLITLAAIPAAGLADGVEVYVNDVEDMYVLEKAGSHVADGVSVIAATGGGFWVARHGRWDDMMGDISEGVGTAALTYEAWEGTPAAGYPNHKQYYFRYNQPDELSFRFQFSHQWKRRSTVYAHMHITPCADPVADQVITLRGYYYWTVEGQVTPPIQDWTSFEVNETIRPGDAKKPRLLPIRAVAPPVDAKESSILKIVIARVVGVDTYTTNKGWGTGAANVALDSVDCHYLKNKLGTEEIMPA